MLYADARRGFFPFAAPYDDPARATDDYRGTLGQLNGLLPVSTNTATWVDWSNVVVAKSNALSTGTLDTTPPATCAPSACTFKYTCTRSLQLPGQRARHYGYDAAAQRRELARASYRHHGRR